MNDHPGIGRCKVCGTVCYLTELGFLCGKHEPQEPELVTYEYTCKCANVKLQYDEDPVDRFPEVSCPICGENMVEAQDV